MMNIACSKCARSFTWECDISTTPCGHVFHTGCIEWSNETTDCYHCQKACEIGQIIKLSFTESISAIEEQIDLGQKSIELEEKSLKCDKLLLDWDYEIKTGNIADEVGLEQNEAEGFGKKSSGWLESIQ